MRFSGNLSKLIKFEDDLKAVPKVYRKLIKNLAEQAYTLTNKSFRGQRDPYGRPWQANQRGGQILRDKGKLSRSFYRRAGPGHVTLGFGAKYASIHQHGGVIKAKNAHLVDYERRNPRRRVWRKGKGRSGAFYAGWKARKKKWSAAGRSGGQMLTDKHHVSWMRTALVFKVGKRWVSKQSVRIPQRMMVPTRARGLPTTWSTAFDRTVSKIFTRHFR